MEGVSRRLRGLMRVEAFLSRRAPARTSREVARAALHGLVRCRVRDLEGQPLHRLPGHLVLCGHGVRVHRRHARVALLRHIVRVLRHARGPVQHVRTRVLLRGLLLDGHAVEDLSVVGRQAMAVAVLVLRRRLQLLVLVGGLWSLLRHGVAHLLAKVGKGRCSVHGVSLGHSGVVHRHGRPVHGRVSGGGRGLAALRVGGAVVEEFVRVHTTLVGTPLVFDHGRLAAKALETAIVGALIWAFTRMDSSMPRQTRRVGEPLAASNMLALVRLLPRVGADVDGQGASLDEGLAAAGCRTRVRALVGVNAVVSLQVRLAVEALVA